MLGTPCHTVGQHKERAKLVSRQIQSYNLHSSSHESEYESHHLKIAPLYSLQPATQIRSVHDKVQVNQGYLSFTWENRKFRWEIQMVHPIPFGKLQKMWAVIWGEAIFQLILVCSADLYILCSGSFFHHVKFYSFILMHKIFTRVVCVNGKHPSCTTRTTLPHLSGSSSRNNMPYNLTYDA